MEEEYFSLPQERREWKNPFGDESGCPTLDGAYQQVLDVFLQRHPEANTKMLDNAFEFARDAHGEQRRISGEQYLFHPLAVAKSLAEWNMDIISLVCGILHDTLEDTSVTYKEISDQFGLETGEIIEGLTKLSKLEFHDRAWLSAENVRRLLAAMGKDVRVLLVKLADRLHNMRTIETMREEKRRRIAHETIELYAPLASRLGMGRVFMELANLAFKTLEPESYESLNVVIQAKIQNNITKAKDIQHTLQSLLAANGVKAYVFGRVKSLYSIWRKLGIEKNEMKDISGWLAYRIICPDRLSCYVALGIVHAMYKPIPGKFKDFVSLPKDNGYQSIHTSVLTPDVDGFEIHIRTKEMHERAEYGIVSQWTYQKGRIANKEALNQSVFLRQMAELHQDVQDSRDLVVNLKGELASRQIQVFTPKGDLISLPEYSTPVDFAYSVHTHVGHHCTSAKVNGRMVHLRHSLKNGDRVEVITKPDSKPNREWLTFVKSANARSKIQSFIREEERLQAIEVGKERLAREAKTLGLNLDLPEYEDILGLRLEELNMTDWNDFYAAVGFNRVPARHILEPILPDEVRRKTNETQLATLRDIIKVDETAGLLFTLALCCKPIWGDEIVGYTTRGRGVNIHRAVCPRLNSNAMPAERRVGVAWGNHGRPFYDTEITVITVNQTGLIAAVSGALQQAGVSIQKLNAITADGKRNNRATIQVALEIKNREHIVEVMGKIRRIKGVMTVERVRGSVFSHKR